VGVADATIPSQHIGLQAAAMSGRARRTAVIVELEANFILGGLWGFLELVDFLALLRSSFYNFWRLCPRGCH